MSRPPSPDEPERSGTDDPRELYAYDGDPRDRDDYSATALGSHWSEQPAPGAATAAVTTDGAGQPWTDRAERTRADAIGDAPVVDPPPDRVEGEVRRFGPGVSAPAPGPAPAGAATVALWRGARPDPGARRRAGRRRAAAAVVVLLSVFALLLWQRHGPPIAVDQVSVRASEPSLGCDDTADVVGVVGTNGRPGTLVYRWVRSDGTSSGRLREKLARGQKQARLHLLWSFRGEGLHRARAELHIVSPSSHRSTARFVYRCG